MEVEIRNKDFLGVLNGFVDEFFSLDYADKDYWAYSAIADTMDGKGEEYCSDEYLEVCKKRVPLIGAPDRHFACPISKMVRAKPDMFGAFQKRVKYDFASEIGAHTSALLSYYPPGGFVGWHTNWNASAYQVLFTWSRTGNGYFRYLDNNTGEVVTIKDKPGWQCRHYYFGPDTEPENLCWHSAYAGEDRITLAYKFCGYGVNDPRDQQARDMRDLLIEEIETE